MQKLRYPLLITAVLLIFMVVYAVATAPVAPTPLAVTPLVQQDISNTLRLTGTVTPRDQSRLAVSQLSQVTAIHVAVGQTVAQGDALCTCAPTQVLPAMSVDQLAPLLTGNSATAGQQPGTLYADRDGVILQLPQIGDTLLPAVPAILIGDPADYVITLRVPELYADSVQVGQSAEFLRDNGTNYRATVTQVAPTAVQTFSLTGNDSAVVDCILSPNTTPAQPPMTGTSVQVKLYTDQVEDAFTVPYSAVYQVGEQEYIAVWQSGKLVPCAVQSGYQLVDCVQVTPQSMPLQMGDWIVTDSTQLQADTAYAVHVHA